MKISKNQRGIIITAVGPLWFHDPICNLPTQRFSSSLRKSQFSLPSWEKQCASEEGGPRFQLLIKRLQRVTSQISAFFQLREYKVVDQDYVVLQQNFLVSVTGQRYLDFKN